MLENLNEEIVYFKETAIMQIANFGRKYQFESGNYIYPAWFGEGDTSTSNLINNKTIEALNQGKTILYISKRHTSITIRGLKIYE